MDFEKEVCSSMRFNNNIKVKKNENHYARLQQFHHDIRNGKINYSWMSDDSANDNFITDANENYGLLKLLILLQ